MLTAAVAVPPWRIVALAVAMMTAPSGLAAPGPVARGHELHETYADLAIEEDVIGGRIRFFKGQLEAGVGTLVDADAVELRPGAETDALVLRYIRDHLLLKADGRALEPAVLLSGEEELGHHAGWWVVLRWTAPAPVRRLRVVNTLQFGLFDDQRNVMRIVRLPGGAPATYHTVRGAEEVVVETPSRPGP